MLLWQMSTNFMDIFTTAHWPTLFFKLHPSNSKHSYILAPRIKRWHLLCPWPTDLLSLWWYYNREILNNIILCLSLLYFDLDILKYTFNFAFITKRWHQLTPTLTCFVYFQETPMKIMYALILAYRIDYDTGWSWYSFVSVLLTEV